MVDVEFENLWYLRLGDQVGYLCEPFEIVQATLFRSIESLGCVRLSSRKNTVCSLTFLTYAGVAMDEPGRRWWCWRKNNRFERY